MWTGTYRFLCSASKINGDLAANARGRWLRAYFKVRYGSDWQRMGLIDLMNKGAEGDRALRA